MAGHGPPPKLRRRRSAAPAGGEWILVPSTGRRGPVPRLRKSLRLSSATHEWWKEIWHSPVARMWDPSMVPALEELAILRDRFMDGKLSLANEIRLRSDSFGLTVKGREQLRWMIVDEVESPDQLAEQRRKIQRRREPSEKLGRS